MAPRVPVVPNVPRYTVGGTISGLTGLGLVLQNNGVSDLAVAAFATAFTFTDSLAGGSPYSISVRTQPSGPTQSCVVTNGSGSVGNGNVTNAVVTCTTPSPPLPPLPPPQTFVGDIGAAPYKLKDSMLVAGPAFTMEGWIYLRESWDGTWIMGKGEPLSSGGVLRNFALQLTNDGSNRLEFGAPAFQFSTPSPLPLRKWTHFAVVRDNSVATLYVNGVEVATRSGVPAIPAAPDLVFSIGEPFDRNGNVAGGSRPFRYGRQFRVWRVARTPAQLLSAMGESMPSDRTGLVAAWAFDENGGLTARDLSGNNRHLLRTRDIGGARVAVIDNGPYFASTTFPPAAGLYTDPSQVDAIDFDSDGDLDLVVYQVASPTFPATERRVLAFRNDGGAFIDATDAVLGTLRMVNPRSTFVGDFNGDGRMDLLIGDTGTDTHPFPGAQSRLLIQSAGRLVDESTSRLPQRISYTHGVAVADIDGDRDLDIYLANYITNDPRLYLNNGVGVFSDVTVQAMPVEVVNGSTANPAAAFVDVNGDSRADLILGGNYDAGGGASSSTPNLLLMNDGSGRFVRDSRFALPPKLHGALGVTVAIVGADLNGDGAQDLVLSTDIAGLVPGLQLLINNGAGQFRDESPKLNLSFPATDRWVVQIMLADMNQDRRPDIVLRTNATFNSPFNSSRSLLLNRGGGVFVDASEPLSVNTSVGLAIGDFDRDGLMDVVTNRGETGSGIRLLRSLKSLLVSDF